MIVPSGDGVASVRAGGIKYHFPELFDCGTLAQMRENLLRPFFARNRSDAPLILIFHSVTNRLYNRILLLLNLRNLLLIYAAKPVGVGTFKIYHSGESFRAVFKLFDGPFFNLGKNGCLAMAICHLCHRLIRPVDGDKTRAGFIAFLCHHFYKFGLVKVGTDDNVLSLSDIYSLSCDKTRIIL